MAGQRLLKQLPVQTYERLARHAADPVNAGCTLRTPEH